MNIKASVKGEWLTNHRRRAYRHIFRFLHGVQLPFVMTKRLIKDVSLRYFACPGKQFICDGPLLRQLRSCSKVIIFKNFYDLVKSAPLSTSTGVANPNDLEGHFGNAS
ncbi:hypothetical protein CEXT_764471 [Caerostris extrusa]|uniref:Uncharacterized protein n=1 Tax=Caerostris extrusa TaxID=172846 RepID=A0AAV4QZV0_CAEEX|nr:hypothetical protein CEXT_764471 [Caerostris extrusa]